MRAPRNPVVMRCSACESECRLHWAAAFDLKDWRWWLDMAVWVFVVIPATRIGRLPIGWALVFLFPMSIALDTARDRLYHAWFAWKHPTRCQGGGHPSLDAL